MSDTDLLIIGAGIAGASAAYCAARSGRRVTVVDAGIDCASLLPCALINPVRGYQGKIAPRGLEGARFSFELIDELVAEGHAIAHGHGLWRPVPDAETRTRWGEQLPEGFPHAWHDVTPESLQLAGPWAGALHLPDSGWVDAAAFVCALLAASRCDRVTGEVAALDTKIHSVTLTDGTRIAARTLLWCGGAWGAARLGFAATYRPGSLIVTRTPVNDVALSHGLYAAPCGTEGHAGTVIGPTHEAKSHDYPPPLSPATAVDRMVKKAQGMFQVPFEVERVWHGVRLDSVTLPANLSAYPSGQFRALTGFGSRGFLMAPLLAHEWACGM